MLSAVVSSIANGGKNRRAREVPGRFLAMLPGAYLKFNGKRFGLKVLPIKLFVPPQPIGIVTLKNRTLSPLAQLFIKCARSVAKPLTAKT